MFRGSGTLMTITSFFSNLNSTLSYLCQLSMNTIVQTIINHCDQQYNMQNSKYSFGEKIPSSSHLSDIHQRPVQLSPSHSNNFNMKTSMIPESKKYQSYTSNGYEATSPRNSYMSTNRQPYLMPASFNNNANMGKSYLRKQSMTETEIIAFVRELEKKILKINQTLILHEQQINDKKEQSGSSTSVGEFSLQNSLYQQMEKDLRKTQQSFHQEIEKLKHQINQRREDVESTLKKIDNENAMIKKYLAQQLQQFRQVNKTETKNLITNLIKQISSQVARIHEASGQAFKGIEENFVDLKLIIQQLKQDISSQKRSIDSMEHEQIQVFISSRKFAEPRIIRYKEIVEKLNDKHPHEILINEVLYFLDKDGYLLDKDCYYLVDRNNRQIQLRDKQLLLLKTHNLLL